ncbi:Sodium/hydrogen exchanger family-domain-containing protein [Mycena epipterygia]|nr:Sodium/hydrogen exchanger family-domain-containing protein [Mycena epipterygia]
MALDLDLLEISPPGLAYICLGGFVVAFSTVSLLIKEKLYINEVILGTIFGIVVGPHCAGIFDPRSWGKDTDAITLEVIRVILATGLFAIGVELPGSYMAKHAKGLLILVVPTMAFGWVTVAAILHGLFPNLVYISCLAIAACLTPTDPIISATIVGGKYALKHVPRNLRLIISAESAANDGLAYPFLSISIYLTVEASRRVAIGKWFLVGWLYEVILGIVLGALLGLGFSYVMKVSHRRGFIDRESYVAQYLALALFTIGVASTIGSDDLLAAFACGNAISWDEHFNDVTENEVFSSVIDLVLNCGCFVYIGAWMPFDTFNSPELGITPWRLIVLFLAILALRRIPSVLLLYTWIPEIRTWREALFTGHFGPMGVGAVFVSTLALTRLPTPNSPPENQQELLAATLQPIVAFVVLGSIIIHGLSIPFFSLGGNMQSRTRSLMATLTRTEPNEWLVGLRRGPAMVPTSADAAEHGAESGTATVIAIREADVHTQEENLGSVADTKQRGVRVRDGSAPALHYAVLHVGADAGDAGKDGNNESPLSEIGLEMDIGTASPVDGVLAGIAAAQ